MASAYNSEQNLAVKIRDHAHPLIGANSDLDPIIDKIGDKSIVLLGEATHGTHEFYSTRSLLTRRLIQEKGFSAVAIEGDWPAVLEVNRFINGHTSDSHAIDALRPFQRFPMWMWRNSVFLDLIERLWAYNRMESTQHRASVFGIDLYSLYESIREVVSYLDRVDPEAGDRARQLYACFDHHDRDPVRYGRHVRIGAQSSCESEAIKVLTQLLEERAPKTGSDGDELFFAKQNAELVRSAESYYRNLFSPLVNTWNVRDRHMTDTVDNLLAHLKDQGRPAKVIIWAHNSHIGDDRATEMGWHGQWNIGQLLRERHPGETYHLGFTTYEGTVTAASMWDQPPELKAVMPALPDSFESLFHRTGLEAFHLDLTDNAEIAEALRNERLERAIGVVYSPDTERVSHYFQARISDQFDSVIHYDQTRSLEPLDHLVVPEVAEPSDLQF